MITVARLVQRTGATAAIAGIVVGIPAVLWQVGRTVLPSRWPAPAEVLDILARPDDGRMLVGFLLLIGCVAWAQLTVSLGAELISALRRRPAVRVELPGLGLSRSIAAMLVGALLSVGSATASAAPAAPVAVSAALLAPDDRVPPPQSPVDGPEYEVQPRDTLWRIAEKTLGDPLRWREIFDLNAGREQFDGERLAEASLLRAGWRLQLPVDALTETDGRPETLVRPGDTLTTIAAERLGDPERATELFEDNRGRIQPDADRLVDPDLIRPGWTLLLPESSHGGAPQLVLPEPALEQPPLPPPDPTPPLPPPWSPPPGALPVLPPTEDAPGASPEPLPHPEQLSPTRVDPPTADDLINGPRELSADHDAALAVVAGASSLVVAGALAALVIRRRRQMRFRLAYHRIPVPDDHAGRVEWIADTTEPVADVAFLDAALRGLTLEDWSGADMPALRTVDLDPTGAKIDLATSAPLPEPFEALEDRIWFVPATVDLPLAADHLDGYCAPFPTLVSVASRPDGHTLFVDLEELGVAHVTGNLGLTTGLLRHIAAELANSPWSQDCEILLVGFGSELVPLNPERLRILPDLTAGLVEVRARIRAARDALDGLDVASLLHGRLTGIAPDTWLPVVLIASGPATEQERAELAELATEIGGSNRLPVAILTAGVALAGQEVHITDQGRLLMPDIGEEPWAAENLSGTTGASLARVLAPTLQPNECTALALPDETWAEGMDEDGNLRPPHPRPPDPEAARRLSSVRQQDPDLDRDLARWMSDDPPEVPMIGILGEPMVRAPGQYPSVRPTWFTEVLVYLSLHPLGVTMQTAMTDLWPDGHKIDPATVRHAFYGARRWAGRGLNGDPERAFVSDMQSDNTYRLRGHILDWDLFRRLRKRGQAHHDAGVDGAIADYEAALGLIRGPVLSALRPGGYAWLNNHDQRHDLQIPGFLVDAAHELVEIAFEAGDLALARRAAETARTVDVDVVFDRPLIDLMRIAHAEDRQAEMERYAEILLDARGFDVPEELPPETFQVLNELLPNGPRRRA